MQVAAHVYLVTNGTTLHYEWGYIGRWTAPKPDGPWAALQPWLGWNSSSPFSSEGVQINLSDNFQLADCLLFTEPGMVVTTNGTLLVALGCVYVLGGTTSMIRIVLLESHDHGDTVTFAGVLLYGQVRTAHCKCITSNMVIQDALLLNYSVPEFNAADLFQTADGSLYLSASPSASLPEGFVGYAGCIVFPVTRNQQTGYYGVPRDANSGSPLPVRQIVPSQPQFAGACTGRDPTMGGGELT
jgi:hypothetical protein